MEHMLSYPELERRLIYSVFVCGKKAKTIDRIAARFFSLLGVGDSESPFAKLKPMNLMEIEVLCRTARTDNYRKNARFLQEFANNIDDIDLEACSVTVLEMFHGIGMKTSRFFVMWTRPNETRYAVLDTHILKWLKKNGCENAPKQTPSSGPWYRLYEREFLTRARNMGFHPRYLDWQIWQRYSGYDGPYQSYEPPAEETPDVPVVEF